MLGDQTAKTFHKVGFRYMCAFVLLLFYFSMMVATWAAVLTISRVANSKNKVKKAGGKKQKVREGAGKGRFASSAVVIALVVIALFSVISGVLNVIDFSRSKDVDKLRKDTKNYATDIYDYVTGKDHDGSLKEGKDADIVLYRGNPLEIASSVYMTMINGEIVWSAERENDANPVFHR